MQVAIWINAFIPRTVAGYTRAIPNGIHRAKTAVPLPAVALANPLNWSLHTDNGFLTDQRGFDSSRTASVRMRSLAVVELSPPSLVSQSHTSSGTTQVDMVTGAVRGFARARMSDCSFQLVLPPHRVQLGSRSASAVAPAASPIMTLGLHAAASDPLVRGAANIVYAGDFVIAPAKTSSHVTVEFVGKVDAFPAFEGYASLNGVTKALFTLLPSPGNTVLDLALFKFRQVKGAVTLP
jgi:hypothetical protein